LAEYPTGKIPRCLRRGTLQFGEPFKDSFISKSVNNQAGLAEVIRIAREVSPDILVFYHCDGNFTAIVSELAEIGVNVINPIQPDCMDAAAVKRSFGDRLALWGTVGTAWQWDFGTPDEIRAEVKHSIDTLGPEGPLLSPAYDLDFTPFENIAAFVEAVDDFGQF